MYQGLRQQKLLLHAKMINKSIKMFHWSRHYKDILGRAFSILLQESKSADLTETDLCKAQVSPEEYYRALKISKS